MIAAVIILLAVGIAMTVIGYLIWKKEMISLLHDYHYDNVSENDKKAFCSLSGWGIISVGVGLLITAVILLMTDSALSFIVFGAGFFVGVALLIYAGNKYNSQKKL